MQYLVIDNIPLIMTASGHSNRKLCMQSTVQSLVTMNHEWDQIIFHRLKQTRYMLNELRWLYISTPCLRQKEIAIKMVAGGIIIFIWFVG